MQSKFAIFIICLIELFLTGCLSRDTQPHPVIELSIERQFGFIKTDLYENGAANVRFLRSQYSRKSFVEQSYWLPCQTSEVRRAIPYLVAISRIYSQERSRSRIDGVNLEYSILVKSGRETHRVNGRVVELTTNDLLDGMVREIESIANTTLAESLFWRNLDDGDMWSATRGLLDWRTQFKRRYADHFDEEVTWATAQDKAPGNNSGPSVGAEPQAPPGFLGITSMSAVEYDRNISVILTLRKFTTDSVATFAPDFAQAAGSNFHAALSDDELRRLRN